MVKALVAVAVTVMLPVPSKLTLLIVRVVASAVAVLALPVNAPTNAVDVTLANPANVVTVAPNETAVLPMVTELFVSAALATVPPVNLLPSRAEAVLRSVPLNKGRDWAIFPVVALGAIEVNPLVLFTKLN